MAVDEAILESAIEGSSAPALRLYAWEPACISLGFAQPVSDVDRKLAKRYGWDLVRRPTGGRAILHTDELTYAVIGRASDPRLTGGVLESYQRLSLALLTALRLLGVPAEAREDRQRTPSESNPVCFEAPSNYEITVGGKKLIGSAQARRKEAVLQHGSLPLHGDITRLVCALQYNNPGSREAAAQRLGNRAATIEGVLGRRISWEEAADKIMTAFEQVLNLELVGSELSAEETARARQLVENKYGHPSWTERV
jgi:lipoate-protein ligase A